MNIRKFENTDRDLVLHLLRLNTPAYFSSSEEKDLIYYFDFHADNYYIVESEENIIGSAGFNLSTDGKTAHLSWDIVHPDYQGKRVGSELTRFRIQLIKEIGSVHTLAVRTSQFAYKFYEKFGLILRETVKDYWAEGFDLYQMDCDIDKTI
ncbi:GNAT family N-acetyltransferase [Dyadobacter sp. CY345]|uniref:GNAT family N-acetyltransferase n=1 Tax=Dyadobacter sp. CY345 TaxID=2909335 RepID=UPI001F1EB0B8|nr:GNAT family N-acetyltransferase [Dyadobacter sp. CY345]MCF2446554.1 GNAT family N-acetyltransferase [Dyadobacter sp. CY345]